MGKWAQQYILMNFLVGEKSHFEYNSFYINLYEDNNLNSAPSKQIIDVKSYEVSFEGWKLSKYQSDEVFESHHLAVGHN